MRRLHILVVVVLIASACGTEVSAPTTSLAPATTTSTTTTSTTTTSTTTTTMPPTTTTEPAPATTAPIDPQFALLFDGFERFGRLGDPAAAMLVALTEAFGGPSADSGWKQEHACSFDGPMRTVTWADPGLRVVFGDGDSDYGSGEHLVTYTTLLGAGTPWRLFGLTSGVNLTQVEQLFPDAEIFPGPSLDYVRFDPDLPSYAWVYGSGEIRDFWGGTEFCGD